MALQEELELQGNYLFRYRGLVPILILIISLGIFIYVEVSSKQVYHDFWDEVYEYICLFVSLFGLFIRIKAVGHTPQNTSGRNTKTQLADELNTTGMYSTVRHPLYVGNFFMWLGIALLTENLWFVAVFVLFYWVYYERIMFAEEQYLRRKFSSVYIRWSEETPAFVPRPNKWIQPKMPFSWKKILKKEKNGIFALFLVFFIFNLLENNLNGRGFTIIYDFWFYGLILSAALYFLLKALKKKTSLLDEKGR